MLPLRKYIAPRRVLRMLAPGETVQLNREIRLLQSLQPIQQMMAEATANYEHLCCEQTAAKMFATVVCLANRTAVGKPIEQSLISLRTGQQRLDEV